MQHLYRNVWQLANLAGCAEPEGATSPGARFLKLVEASTVEAVEYNGGAWDSEMAHEIADGCVPVYTHQRFQIFVDLAAYREDPTELGADGSDMTEAAGVCLYLIAERLVHAIGEGDDESEGGDA